jgi:hypothetical protein
VLQLRHCKAAWQPERANIVKVGAPVLLCAQIEHAAAPQAVLHATLDHQAQVNHGQALCAAGMRHSNMKQKNTMAVQYEQLEQQRS